jgi:hypothetical protein
MLKTDFEYILFIDTLSLNIQFNNLSGMPVG